MKKTASAESRRSLLIAFTVLGLIASVAFLPTLFQSAAERGSDSPTENAPKGLEYYDIRTDKTAAESLLNFRQTAGRDAVQNADVRDRFIAGERRLRQTVPTLKVEYNQELGVPGLIAPDVLQGRAFLTEPTNLKRTDTLRGFLKDNNALLGLTDEQIGKLKTTDFTLVRPSERSLLVPK